MARNVTATIPVNDNVCKVRTIDVTESQENTGRVPGTAVGYVSATEKGDSVIHQTILTVTDLPQAITSSLKYLGSKIYDFPEGRIYLLGSIMSLAETTKSILADTLNAASTGALALGSATASNTALTSTMATFMASTAVTSSATIDVAGAVASGALSAAAFLDGHTTPASVYLNSSWAGSNELDADAKITWSGTITLTWINLGDY